MKIEEIKAAVKEAMASKDAEYQLVEVVRTAMEAAYVESAEVAEAYKIVGHSVQAPTCDMIAKQIRERAGLFIV